MDLSRRQFVLGAGATGLGLLAGCGRLPFSGPEPQPPSRVYRIGYIAIGGTSTAGNFQAFLEQLRGLGYVDGQNLAVEFRSAEFDNGRLPALATELVQRPVEVILAGGTPAHLAAAQATSSIPIVTVVGDPVREGLAASYARPGGNVTGFSILESTLGPKRLELLRDTVAGASRIAVLWNTNNSAKAAEFRETQTAAQSLGLEIISLPVESREEFESAFATARREGAEALIVLGDFLTVTFSSEIVALAARSKLPAMHERRESELAGGLMSYSSSLADNYRRAADYVDRILRGAKPADLPIEQPMRFEFLVNLKAADALGITFPNEIMLQVTEVVQ